ncbi:MAG TPA: hypothetical protein VGS19_15715 [Streptosporangiaceae bacterium]|nr:hypothetical protein [Streptosporangiaceae bacterium]
MRWRPWLRWRAWLPSRQSLLAAAVGAAMLGAAAVADTRIWPVPVAGGVAVAVAAAGRWPVAGTGAAVAALVTGGAGVLSRRAPMPLVVVVALLVLAYLLMLDRAESAMPGNARDWPRAVLLPLLAGGAAAVATAFAATATLSASIWLTVAGVLATGAALLAAVG